MTSTQNYDIIVVLIGILFLAWSVRRLHYRVESLYQNHLTLSQQFYKSPPLVKDVVE